MGFRGRLWRSWKPVRNQRDRGGPPFAQDGLEDAPAVRDGAQIAHTADARSLETRDLDNIEMVLQGPHVDEDLDLEPVAVAVERGDVPRPERHVPVAKIGEHTAVEP